MTALLAQYASPIESGTRAVVEQPGPPEEIILLAWLLVLARENEAGDVSFSWGRSEAANLDGFPNNLLGNKLTQGEVFSTMDSSIEDAVVTILSKTACSSTASVDRRAGVLLLSSAGTPERQSKKQDEADVVMEVQLVKNEIRCRPVYCTKDAEPWYANHLGKCLEDRIQACRFSPHRTIKEVLQPTKSDLEAIWSWNQQLPLTYDSCMHEHVSRQCESSPSSTAIASWDGDLTYAELERYSGAVAYQLICRGVKPHDIVPLCFEKSKWAAIAVLAAMKSGATFVMIDPSLPTSRLQNILSQVNAHVVISSRLQNELSETLIPGGTVVVIEEALFKNIPLDGQSRLTPVPPSTVMYIIFTSGSTGTPKGVKVSHRSYTSSAFPRAKAVGYDASSRVLDFAAYAFDVSIDSMLLTFVNGGCLCIPSDEERMNDINGVMKRMEVNYAGLTPSVARILDLEVIASMRALGLGGEAASVRDVNFWGQYTRIVIGYGPCECTIGCTINSSAATGKSYISLGKGNGSVIWIVDPDDHDRLLPVGAIGELLIEGPIVGQGYLNDPTKTASVFIGSPPWLLAGYKNSPGRWSVLYKTGDLGSYDPDGSGGITFAGRKDTQVKLRGQRVELGEIESQLTTCLPATVTVVAEVITPARSGGRPVLVAFIAQKSTRDRLATKISRSNLDHDVASALKAAQTHIKAVLPRYMLPTAYVPVSVIPFLISGKVDRKSLKQYGTSIDLNETTSQSNEGDSTPAFRTLRRIWARLLDLDESTIQPGEDFFAAGGDSVTAMKLVSACRAESYAVSVANVFEHPTLRAMGSALTNIASSTGANVSGSDTELSMSEVLVAAAAAACGVPASAVEDLYPCTPTQESLFTFSLKSLEPYIAQRVAKIPAHLDIEKWKTAWREVVAATPMLRTRLAQIEGNNFTQVVVQQEIYWSYGVNLEEFLEKDRAPAMGLGQDLARFAIIEDTFSGNKYMVWTIHHVLYDGWSEPLVLQQVLDHLEAQDMGDGATTTGPGSGKVTSTQMKDFVRFLSNVNTDDLQRFWKNELQGANGPQYPPRPDRDYYPDANCTSERNIVLKADTRSSITLATLIRGAWALVLSQYIDTDDVVFCETLTGRDIPLPAVAEIIGPLIATVPVRIRIHRSTTVQNYLQSVQRAIISRIPYQHTGMQHIRKVSVDAQHACETGTGLVIQPESTFRASELGFDNGDAVKEAINFNPYALMLACGTYSGGFRVCASFDDKLVSIRQMDRILLQLEVTCQRFLADPTCLLENVSCLSPIEVDDIWSFNATPPLLIDGCGSSASSNIVEGSVYPPAVVHWVCSRQTPSILSPIGAIGELWLESNLLLGTGSRSPAWLTEGSVSHSGRQGRLFPTDDLVTLREDGKVIFVGRKGNKLRLGDVSVDVFELERTFAKYLPRQAKAIPAVFTSASDAKRDKPLQRLIVLVEEEGLDKANALRIHQRKTDFRSKKISSISVQPWASIKLVTSLKALHKGLEQTSPPHMLPFAFITVQNLADVPQNAIRASVAEFVSALTEDTILEFKDRLCQVWSTVSGTHSLTTAELVLRDAWAGILGIDAMTINTEDNFFRLGGDSVLAMKLTSKLRDAGHLLGIADIFRYMRLKDAAVKLKLNNRLPPSVKPAYTPFCLVDNQDTQAFLSESILPQLVEPRVNVRDVYPVTDAQRIDIDATIRRPHTSYQYTMLFFQDGVDEERLVAACRRLVVMHDILRSVFIRGSRSYLQVVIEGLEISPRISKQDGDIREAVMRLCKDDAQAGFALGTSFTRIFFVHGNAGQSCLVLGLSHVQYDGESLPQLLQDLSTIYYGSAPRSLEPFSSYMSITCGQELQTTATTYWSKVLRGSTLSVLPETRKEITSRSILKSKHAPMVRKHKSCTIANLICTAWALTLARRLGTNDVTFASVTSGRFVGAAGYHDAMGPCYQFTPVRISFRPDQAIEALLGLVQLQSAESSRHDSLSFEKISRLCAGWSTDSQFYDSIVHHHEVEEGDTMLFGDRECQVDTLNPDGFAAYPLKVLSFVQDGQRRVGLLGSDSDAQELDALLDELIAALEELTSETAGSNSIKLDYRGSEARVQ